MAEIRRKSFEMKKAFLNCGTRFPGITPPVESRSAAGAFFSGDVSGRRER
jgi:hypothetical protein